MQGINPFQSTSLLSRPDALFDSGKSPGNSSGVSAPATQSTQVLEASVSIGTQAQQLQKDFQVNPAANRQTPEQTADNILGAIRTALDAAKSAGKDEKELTAILKQGAKGFRDGFREAVGTLAALGGLDDVKSEISETRSLVRAGFAELRAEFVPKQLEPKQLEPKQAGLDQSLKLKLKSPAQPIAKTALTEISSFSQTYAKTNRFASDGTFGLHQSGSSASTVVAQSRTALIKIETAEGDVISIDLAAYSRQGSVASQNIRVSESAAGQTGGFSVQGDLSEAEFAALDDLLNQVDAVAKSFFEGDLDLAFARASSMGFDSEQLVGLSMSLTETTLSANATYGSVNGHTESSASRDDLRRMSSYAQELERAVERASNFDRPEHLVSKLLSRFTEDSSLERIEAFNRINDNLLDALSRVAAGKRNA